ncbi:hypothetical protein WJX81_006571 [Elliptochloris bilobata]|uniref:Protein kinase domain-containing protein n=1 Tax=Elliptochloris bilobata TaxID=381761 RepID=A0AAW1RGW1_9CHLO
MAVADIDYETEVQLEEKIGSGAFGSVYRGRWRGRLVAIKVLRAAFPGDAAAELDSFRREVRVLSSLQHARIVGLLGACMAPPHICLVEELVSGGSLFDALHRRSRRRGPSCAMPLAYPRLLQVATDVADAMAYLHQPPAIVHRDLKSSNVLLDAAGRAVMKDRTFMSTVMTSAAGTPAYMAPETFEGQQVTEKVDMYSFGVLLWECLTGEQPWAELSTPMQVIYVVGVLGRRPRIPAGCAAELRSLICDCWQRDPRARPPFAAILIRLQEEQQRLQEA